MNAFPDNTRWRRAYGMTLIEIMVALALGSLLMAGVGVLFAEIRQSSRVERGMSEIQESARFALDELAYELRMAGYYGCAANGNSVINTLNDPTAFDWDFNTQLEGYEYDSGGSWLPNLPAEISGASPAPTNDSDIFTVRGLDQFGDHKVSKHPGGSPPGSAALQLTSHGDIEECEIVVAMKCPHAAVFQITNLNESQSSLAHNQGTPCSDGPGNDTDDLGTRFTGGSVARVSTKTYYIARDGSGIPGLYVREPLSGVRELVSGVESMSVQYGEDTDGDQRVDSYSDADGVADWGDVVSVRLSLLARSGDTVAVTAGAQNINFEGVNYGSDGRIRRQFRTTIALRNRLP